MVIIVKGYASFGRFTAQLEPGGRYRQGDKLLFFPPLEGG
jgi:hypothetical protein